MEKLSGCHHTALGKSLFERARRLDLHAPVEGVARTHGFQLHQLGLTRLRAAHDREELRLRAPSGLGPLLKESEKLFWKGLARLDLQVSGKKSLGFLFQSLAEASGQPCYSYDSRNSNRQAGRKQCPATSSAA
jgi:hypothetical protein